MHGDSIFYNKHWLTQHILLSVKRFLLSGFYEFFQPRSCKVWSFLERSCFTGSPYNV